MENMTNFIEKGLALKVNREKTALDRPWKRDYLGFSFTYHKEPKIRIARKSIRKMKHRIRKLTSRSHSISMEERIKRLNQYLMGWCGYFSLADTPTVFKNLDKWIRRRLRMIIWKQWKKPKTKIKKLIQLGVQPYKAYEWGNSRKSLLENL
jgi:RNA-directed DNA polymerase